jgi:hypothetical protein
LSSHKENKRLYDGLVSELAEGPYWIVDILPEQVPGGAAGQYFAVERYFLRPERIESLRRRYAELLLRLNCYDDMAVSFDYGESWEENPEPEAFAERAAALADNGFLRVLFPARRVMLELDSCDTYMTVYDPERALPDRLGRLAAAEGFFLWHPPEGAGGTET